MTGVSRSIAGNFPTYPLRLQLIWMSLLKGPMVALVTTRIVVLNGADDAEGTVEPTGGVLKEPVTNKSEEINTNICPKLSQLQVQVDTYRSSVQ